MLWFRSRRVAQPRESTTPTQDRPAFGPGGYFVQGVVKLYDPSTGEGLILADSTHEEHLIGPGALEGSVFRMLRQGQRVIFDIDEAGRATHLRTGSEPDMGLPTADV